MFGVRVFDNEGRTIDRYTVIIDGGKFNDIYTMSDNPLSPLGVNQFSWRLKKFTGKLKEFGGELLCDDKELGESEIPEEIMRAIYLRQFEK